MSRRRHQVMLNAQLSTRLDELAAGPGASKSSILACAVEAWINRSGSNELDDRFGHRLDRLSRSLDRIERNTHVLIETLALFIRYELAIHAPLAEQDDAGRALGRDRYQAFIAQVGEQLASGKRTLGGSGDTL
jgi:predicted transcriptional regulator